MHRTLLLALLLACTATPQREDRTDINRARARNLSPVAWSPWSPETFARAAREGRFILIDGVAEWCHWCHVMDATTYRDPAVVKLLAEKFIAIQVDVDERPDLYQRYAPWGWPATVLLTPQGEEIGKYRGYLEPAELLAILQSAGAPQATTPPPGHDLPAPREALPWIAARALQDLDATYDRERGSWGRPLKLPMGPNLELELRRAARGDTAALARAHQTFTGQRALIDPVWGGLYQYSTRSVWTHPHFEKLMTIQAANLEAYARGYRQTKDPKLLADAQKIADYMENFLLVDGLFRAAQDADVGAHDPSTPFIDGHDYFPLPDTQRRALGLPRVDPGHYAAPTGLALAALATLHEATGDPHPLEVARRAAHTVTTRLMDPTGRLKRETPHGRQVRYLMDHAQLARGLARLAEVTGEKPFLDTALRVSTALLQDFARPDGALLTHTPDPDAQGVFARPQVDFRQSTAGARAFLTLARLTGDPTWRDRAHQTLAAIATPTAIAGEGKWISSFLLALDEAGAFPWPMP